ncbi:MAG: tryptophan synthase subunit alpha [Gemmatimonadota bacterium]
MSRSRAAGAGSPGRLTAVFSEGARAGRRAFIPYLTHGYPTPADTPRLLERLAETGADVIELGVPFSDPLADGPTIQRASWEALGQGVTLEGSLRLIAEMADALPPIVLFSYLNPILGMGLDRFCESASAAGVAGILVTDLPVGADPEREGRLAAAGPEFIRLAAPTTSQARLEEIARRASGFLYYISRTGVTGSRPSLAGGLAEEVARLRRRVRLPVAVGFGISTPGQAREVAGVADGVVVGSALIEALERGESGFVELATSLAEAVHEVG